MKGSWGWELWIGVNDDLMIEGSSMRVRVGV
jgi:hypothetical protein